MKQWQKKLISLICCIALVVTSVYISEPKKAEAATATSTISIVDEDHVEGYKMVASGGSGEVNWGYTGVASDYAGGFNFLTSAFVEKYITFGGGMTAADLLDGLDKFYVATSTVLQMNWSNRTTAFTVGWSFTLSKDTLLPYRNTAGTTSYMALDKEYIFTFRAGNTAYDNVVHIADYKLTTWSLQDSGVWGIGNNAVTTELGLTNSNITDYEIAYTPIQNNEEYRGYLTIDGVDMLDLTSKGLEVRTVLDENANGPVRCLQVNAWGTVRDSLVTGSVIILREGMPLYYKDTLGNSWKAKLEGTYIYTCTGPNTDCTHVFSCAKYTANKNIYGLQSLVNRTTGRQSADNDEQFYNLPFKTSGQISGANQSQMLDLALVSEYVDIAGYTISKAKEMGIVFRFIPSANVVQIGFSTTAVTTLKAGDVITLRKGMPTIFNNGASCATLDSTYEITITANNGTNLTFTLKEIPEVGSDYSLSGSIGQGSDDGYASTGYWNVFLNSGLIPEDEEFSEGFLDVDKEVLANYFSLTGYDSATVLNNGYVTLKRYNIAALRGLRVVYQVSKITFTSGMVMMFKKGLPITYATADGSLKKRCLDKDYGFVYDGSTFVYDASLTASYDFTMNMGTYASFTEDETYVKCKISTTNTSGITKEQYPILEQTIEEETWNTYIDFCGMDYDAFVAAGLELRYLVFANQFRIQWLQSDTTWLSNLESNNRVTFKKGLPVPVTTDAGLTVDMVLTDDITFYVYADDETVTIGEEIVDYTTTITSMSGTGFFQTERYRLNLDVSSAPDLFGIDYKEIPLLSNEETAPYIDICGIEATTLVGGGVEVKYIPTANVFQIVFGADHTWLSVGDEITFKQGMPIPVTVDGETVTVTLQNTITYQVDSVTTDAPYVTMSAHADPAEFYINPNTYDGIQAGADLNYTFLDADGEATILDDYLSGSYIAIPTATVVQYMDFCGFTASELDAFGVKVMLICDGGNEVMQIQTGSMAENMIAGEIITFKKGLPFTYTTTDGYKKVITLARDYTFVVGEGITADGNTYVCRWRYTETEPSEWRLKSGVVNNVSGSETQAEGYFNNLPLGSSTLLEQNTSLNYFFTTEQMNRYFDFAGLDVEEYGIQAIAIITESDQVVQLRWGKATSSDLEGKTVTFKAGLPIIVDGTVVYRLLADIVYKIEKTPSGNNGYCLSNAVEVTKTQPGDADGDYVLNVNDINLIREALAEIVVTDVDMQDINEDGVVNSVDLVLAKKNFDVPENEANGTETYTLIAKQEVGVRTINASTDDTKDAAKAADALTTYKLNADLGTNNYLRLTYKSDTDLRGEFIYTVDGGDAVTEEFFLEATESQFEQFLDVYRKNSINDGVKNGSKIVLDSIVLYNLSTTDSTNVRLYKVETAARTINTNDMLWAENEDVKIGVDLNMGGSLAWMECLKYDIYEYISDDESIIGTAAQCEAVGGDVQMDSGVNLVNIYDLGRQIQQSYYSVPTGQKDWDGVEFVPGICDESKGEQDWPYNPVQAGDGNDNQSQIVDYRVVNKDGVNVIYVKTRAMDWSYAETHNSANGRTTDSYMEAWYSLDGSLVNVDNRFIDWSGYDYSVKDNTQEMPALYVGQGLNTLVSDEAGARKWYPNLGSWTEEDAYNNNTTTTDWYAFVNGNEEAGAENAFGVGIYIPGVEQTTAGRPRNHRKVEFSIWEILGGESTTINMNAGSCPMLDLGYEYLNNLYQNNNKYQNCFVSNTSYIAPVRSGWMKGYEDYSYSYVLTADMLNNIDNAFTELKENDVVDNSSLAKWEINPNG